MKTRNIILTSSIGGLVLLILYFHFNNKTGTNKNFQKKFALNEASLEKINKIVNQENYNSLRVNISFDKNLNIRMNHLDNSSTQFEEKDLENLKLIRDKLEFYGIAKMGSVNLIIMSMFMGNGYGYLKTNKETVENLKKQAYYGINGLEIVSVVELGANWYRIGFT